MKKLRKNESAFGIFIKDKNENLFTFHSAHWDKDVCKDMIGDIKADEKIIKKIKVQLSVVESASK